MRLYPITDSEFQANAQLFAAAVLAHPLAFRLSEIVVDVVFRIASSDAPATSYECGLLRRALSALEQAEIRASRAAA